MNIKHEIEKAIVLLDASYANAKLYPEVASATDILRKIIKELEVVQAEEEIIVNDEDILETGEDPEEEEKGGEE